MKKAGALYAAFASGVVDGWGQPEKSRGEPVRAYGEGVRKHSDALMDESSSYWSAPARNAIDPRGEERR